MSETMTELKPVAWFFRWPGSTSWRNSDVDPTGRIPNEQFATVLCAYDHETIAAALSAAEARIHELEAALSKLAAEVSGLEVAEVEVRGIIGNTNWNVLMLRRDEARSLEKQE